MVVLGMDTATQALAVGLGRDGDVLGSVAYLIARGHSRLLQPTLASALKSCGLGVKDVERVVVGTGPGSYTGVRLGVATAKAMATALGIPLTPVSTLAVLAQAAVSASSGPTAVVMPLLYARRQRAFGTIYVKDGATWRSVVEQQVLPVGAWMELLGQVRGDPAWQATVVHDFIPKYDVLHLLVVPETDTIKSLPDVAGSMGVALLEVGSRPDAMFVEGLEIHQVVPDYALQVEAQVKLAERRSGEHGDG